MVQEWYYIFYLLWSGMVLGQGAFGRVIKAEAIGILEHEDVTVVAVKMVKGMFRNWKKWRVRSRAVIWHKEENLLHVIICWIRFISNKVLEQFVKIWKYSCVKFRWSALLYVFQKILCSILDVRKYFALFIIHVSEMFCFAQNVKNVVSMPVI